MSPGTLTVVVPSRDRPGPLGHCLRALAAQEVAVEVVVVDDGSLAEAAVAASVQDVLPTARLLRGEGRGPAVARNLGAGAATTDLIAFTDDDCRPRPGWAGALVHRLTEDPTAAAAAGPTVVDPAAGSAAIAAQVVTNHLMDHSLDAATGRLGFAPTSNLAVRAAVFGELPFDEDFPLAAGEDRDWCDRLTAAGHSLVLEPDAVVDHHPDLDLRRFWRQQHRYGRGAARYRADRAEGLAPRRFYTDLLRKGLAEGPTAGALVLLAQAATATGVARERLTR